MTGTGFATKLCLDENGKVVNEYVERDGICSDGCRYDARKREGTGIERGNVRHLTFIFNF